MPNRKDHLNENEPIDRREFVRRSMLFTAGASLAVSAAAAPAADVNPGQPPGTGPQSGACPCGKIGNLQVSRLILGSNLITFYIHSRDLDFINNLARHYNTEKKILETLAWAEACGLNTIMTQADEHYLGLLRQHREEGGGRLQWIVGVQTPQQMDKDAIRKLVQDGADALYIHGVTGDALCAAGNKDLIAQTLAYIKQNGVPAGVGGHDLKVVKFCEQNQVGADFYVKTFHHHDYPTAPKPDQLKGPYAEIPGYWCQDPVETAAVMKAVEKPFIAFKVMAAGAIPPASAFKYVFQNGADFVLAGMFDFEIEADVRIAREAVAAAAGRPRPWRA